MSKKEQTLSCGIWSCTKDRGRLIFIHRGVRITSITLHSFPENNHLATMNYGAQSQKSYNAGSSYAPSSRYQHQPADSRGPRRQGSFLHLLSPRQRLDTLFAVHAFCSLVIGIVGYVFPKSAHIFFSTESEREFGVARAILRLYCSLIAAQGIMIWRARKINDGEIKRAFVQAYFLCFLFSTLALINEHTNNEGIVSGKLFGILKIIVMIALTAGYGWFTFFQPPVVFTGLGMYVE